MTCNRFLHCYSPTFAMREREMMNLFVSALSEISSYPLLACSPRGGGCVFFAPSVLISGERKPSCCCSSLCPCVSSLCSSDPHTSAAVVLVLVSRYAWIIPQPPSSTTYTCLNSRPAVCS
ncbi:hypothetical protein BU14_0427s0004 [Porphyra umbilicalis]|uniref:Uncharacterized protein n=1 Tax=Porphyra umbilicalis TaxID=2786 RepID=A0A1X6NV58_PORUM|nr:hypothetical protein BU14_0427s0004 [Porphyra umbilicalis]|eukprot:OSX72514.1 hypothetical protein BU14_0427s0004 [Porphyra umbilicalis]